MVTKHQAEMHCCTYCSNHTKNLGTRAALFEVMDDMARVDASAKEKYGDAFEEKKLGSKLHRAFMAEIGDEMCHSEVAHHANRCPEYFCSRPEKQVHFYKKAFAVNTGSHNKPATRDAPPESWTDEEHAKDRKLTTKPSDLDMYERRT